jgi:biofilm PGA synthesis lipoprotein PgaB
MRWLLLLLVALLPVRAAAQGTRFVAIAWHDVVDRREDRSDDAVTTQSLVETFDWLKAEGWTPVSLDRIEAAGRGGPPLPDKAVLLSFDDGYASFYSRVYPLLLAYNYPAVLGLVTSWMEVPPGGQVDYGGRNIPRDRLVSWSEVRRMQASGLVEVVSHSHDLHTTVRSTPQGNTAPAARSWAYDPATGRRETDAEHRARIRADLSRSADIIARETGHRPRALVWPFGRFSGPALEEAKAAGFDFALTLEPEAADARQPMRIHRYYPTQDPALGILAFNLAFAPPRAETVRLACIDLAPLAAATTPEAQDALLGQLVEDVRTLGATGVVLEPGPTPPDGGARMSAWLPNAQFPMAADLFGRAARQLSTRAGVEVFVRLRPGDGALAADVARVAPIDGLLLGGAGAPAPPATAPTVTDIREARATGQISPEMAAAVAIDPRLRLLLEAPSPAPAGPPPGAERQLLPAGTAPAALAETGWLAPAQSGRVVLTLPKADAAAQRAALRAAQQQGVTAVALCPFDPAATRQLAPAFSAANFPRRP